MFTLIILTRKNLDKSTKALFLLYGVCLDLAILLLILKYAV